MFELGIEFNLSVWFNPVQHISSFKSVYMFSIIVLGYVFDSVIKVVLMHLCYHKKPNFPERFRADNGKNRNIQQRNLSKQTIK